MVNKGFPKK